MGARMGQTQRVWETQLKVGLPMGTGGDSAWSGTDSDKWGLTVAIATSTADPEVDRGGIRQTDH